MSLVGSPPQFNLAYEDYAWLPDGSAFRQRDLTPRVVYDERYLDLYRERAANVRRLAEMRLGVLEAFVGGGKSLLDFGCGTNDFAKLASDAGWNAYGYDVVDGSDGPRMSRDASLSQTFDVVTFFDSLEHLPHPTGTIQALSPQTLMVSVPECHYPQSPAWFMGWKHHRAGEHLYHWNRRSLDIFLSNLGYRLLMLTTCEDTIRTPYHPSLNNILTVIYQRRAS